MRVLVTGGAGFIGSHLAERLVKDGHLVRVLDDLSAGRLTQLEHVRADIDFIEGDIRDGGVLREAVEGVEVVFHQAARTSVPRSVKDPLGTNDVNVAGTLNLLVAARDAGVRRFVFASSSSVYGASQVLPQREDQKLAPMSPYAVSKLTGELYCQVFHRLYGLETFSLRYFNVFGPRQGWESQYAAVIPKFIRALMRGESPVIFGDGTQSRDFTYVDNVVEANVLAMKAARGAGEAFNIACGAQATVTALAGAAAWLMGSHSEPVYSPARSGDILHSLADISKAREYLGYAPRVGFLEGLARTVVWAQEELRVGNVTPA